MSNPHDQNRRGGGEPRTSVAPAPCAANKFCLSIAACSALIASDASSCNRPNEESIAGDGERWTYLLGKVDDIFARDGTRHDGIPQCGVCRFSEIQE